MKIFADCASIAKCIRLGSKQRRHRGLALPTVLLIAIVGALLVATIFNISSRFGTENILFRRTYADQTTATSHIERAKGLIAARIATDSEALHPTLNDTWNEHPAVETLDDIRIYLDIALTNAIQSPASDTLMIDEALPEGRRVTVNVYDLTYVTANVPTPTNDTEFAERLLLPAPIDLTAVAASPNHWSGNYAEGDLSTQIPPDPGGAADLDLSAFGAYLVRVEIFNRDGRLARRTDEAFFIRADVP